MRMFIDTNGETTKFDKPVSMDEIRRLLRTQQTHSFMLRDRVHVLIMDDFAATKELPVSIPGTALYWEKCGGPVDWHIRGPVFVAPDSDFAMPSKPL